MIQRIFKALIGLTLYWWMLYLLARYADTHGANFVAIICGMLGLAFALYLSITVHEGTLNRVEEMARMVASNEYNDYLIMRKQIKSAEAEGVRVIKLKPKEGTEEWSKPKWEVRDD